MIVKEGSTLQKSICIRMTGTVSAGQDAEQLKLQFVKGKAKLCVLRGRVLESKHTQKLMLMLFTRGRAQAKLAGPEKSHPRGIGLRDKMKDWRGYGFFLCSFRETLR